MNGFFFGDKFQHSYRPQTKLREGHVFTPVILFTGGGDVCATHAPPTPATHAPVLKCGRYASYWDAVLVLLAMEFYSTQYGCICYHLVTWQLFVSMNTVQEIETTHKIKAKFDCFILICLLSYYITKNRS